MKKVLGPVVHRDSYTRLIEKELIAWLDEAIFRPLIDFMEAEGPGNPGKPEPVDRFRENAVRSGAVERALISGRISYAGGVFSGTFSAAISRELRQIGAKWDKESKTFRLAPTAVPRTIKGAADDSIAKAKTLHEKMDRLLADMAGNVELAEPGIKFTSAVDNILTDLQKQFVGSVEAVRSVDGIQAIEVPTQITGAVARTMRDELTNNLNLAIKNFASERIPEMRGAVAANASAGYRTDRLAKVLRAEFGVDRRKAEFLADQETGLFVSKYRQSQAEDLGSAEYVWSTSKDERVRPDHRALDGRQFQWAHPPICDRASGRHGHPGEDFRCRCVALPILDLRLMKDE